MPKLLTVDNNNTCFLCGCQAFYISYNSKKMRCVEKITQCLGFIKKAEMGRQRNMTKEERRDHMKKMSDQGNATLKDLHSDKSWVKEKGNKISKEVKRRGGHNGVNNPMYGKRHSEYTKQQLSYRAKHRDPSCYINGTKTKILKGLAVPKELKSDWLLYNERARNYTYKTWKIHYEKINLNGFERGQEYELDHKFSLYEGFLKNVPIEIIGHWKNLELIPKQKNRSKGTSCSISLEELYSLIGKCSTIPSDSPSSDTTIS